MTELKESQKLFIHPVRHVGRQTTPHRNATMEPMQPIDRLPGTEDWNDRIRSKKEPTKMTRMKLLKLQPKIKLKLPRLHSVAAIDRPETTKQLPPITEVVWQQPQEMQLCDKYKNPTSNINNTTHTLYFKQKNDVESQTSPIKEISPQVSGSSETKLRAYQYNAPMTPRNDNMKSNETQLTRQPMTVEMTTIPLRK